MASESKQSSLISSGILTDLCIPEDRRISEVLASVLVGNAVRKMCGMLWGAKDTGLVEEINGCRLMAVRSRETLYKARSTFQKYAPVSRDAAIIIGVGLTNLVKRMVAWLEVADISAADLNHARVAQMIEATLDNGPTKGELNFLNALIGFPDVEWPSAPKIPDFEYTREL